MKEEERKQIVEIVDKITDDLYLSIFKKFKENYRSAYYLQLSFSPDVIVAEIKFLNFTIWFRDPKEQFEINYTHLDKLLRRKIKRIIKIVSQFNF